MKAQVSAESIFIIGVLLMIFTIISAVILVREGNVRDIKDLLEYRLECSKISTEVENIHVMGSGSSGLIDMSKNLTFFGSERVVIMGNYYCILCCPVTNGSHSVFKVNGTVQVRNENGEVLVNGSSWEE
ncbi:MAG: hypothetical protein ACTSPB_19160 [Candidatus Thorarchaeota archaeon]